MVYLIHAEETMRYKIGTSENINARIKAMDTGCPTNLNLIHYVDGNKAIEKRLHHKFNKYRKKGEWFQFDENTKIRVIEYMNNNKFSFKKFKNKISTELSSCNLEEFDLLRRYINKRYYKEIGRERNTKRKINNNQRNVNRRNQYQWTIRAQSVGIKSLKPIRPTLKEKSNWINSILREEKRRK